LNTAQQGIVSVCAVNFGCDENLGYLIRAASCFGATEVHVIGNVPDRSYLSPISGSLIDYVTIIQHSNPHDFLAWTNAHDVQIVSAEISDSACSVYDYAFDTQRKICIAVGNEHTGVPAEILHNSDVVYVPMPGIGFCLNTAQTANIMLFEFNRQQNVRKASEHLRAV
jgi:tRNA G18 (ribose-2'-O)-methylase SpoU